MTATLTEDLKALAKTEGADLVGIAAVDRFHEAPKMTHPNGILPDARAVVVIAVKYPDAAIDRWCKPPAESMFFYQSVQLFMTTPVMPMIQFKIYRFLEAMNQRDPFQATCAWGTISCGRCLHVCHSHGKGRKEGNVS